MIWDVNPETATDPERDFSPGDNDPILGNFILQDLETAMDSAEEGSHAKQELRMRFEYVDRAVDNMHRDEEYHRWWDYYAPQLALSLVNATSPCGEKPSGSVGSNCSQLLQSG